MSAANDDRQAPPVQIGLIGAGPWGRNFIKTIASRADIDLAWVGSRNPETAELVPPGTIVDPDWRQLLKIGSADGVVIATPPDVHVPMAMAALDAGLSICVEKPLALRQSEARNLLAAAKSSDCTVLVDHVYLYHSAWLPMKDFVAASGGVRKIEARAGQWGPFRADVPVLWDWAPHDLAMCMDMIGDSPTRLTAERTQQTDQGEILRLRLDFSGGATAELVLGNIFEAKARRFRVQCGEGSITFDDLAENKLVVDTGDAPAYAGITPLSNLMDEFAEAIRSGECRQQDLALGVSVVEQLERVQTALDSGSM